MVTTFMRKPALLITLLTILSTIQANAPGRTILALFSLTSTIYTQLALSLNPDQTTQWVLIDNEGQEIELNAVQLNQGVAMIHFDLEDTHVVPFEMHSTWQNFIQVLMVISGILLVQVIPQVQNYPKSL